jgi:hypothetical protein
VLISQTATGFDQELLADVASQRYVELIVGAEAGPLVVYQGGSVPPLTLPAPPSSNLIGLTRVTLSDDGTPLLFAFRQEGEPNSGNGLFQLVALDGTTSVELGPIGHVLRDSFNVSRAPRFRPLRGVVPPRVDATPFYGAVLQHTDALRVVGNSAGTAVDIALPGTAQPELTCAENTNLNSSGGTAPCDDLCVEDKDSLEHQAFAAARGPNDVWVAYAMGRFGTRPYNLVNNDGSQACRVEGEAQSAELFLLRVPLDGTAPSVVFSVPIDGAIHYQNSDTIRNDFGPIAAHLFGDQLAIAVGTRVTTSPSQPYRILVFRVDTSLLPG